MTKPPDYNRAAISPSSSELGLTDQLIKTTSLQSFGLGDSVTLAYVDVGVNKGRPEQRIYTRAHLRSRSRPKRV